MCTRLLLSCLALLLLLLWVSILLELAAALLEPLTSVARLLINLIISLLDTHSLSRSIRHVVHPTAVSATIRYMYHSKETTVSNANYFMQLTRTTQLPLSNMTISLTIGPAESSISTTAATTSISIATAAAATTTTTSTAVSNTSD